MRFRSRKRRAFPYGFMAGPLSWGRTIGVWAAGLAVLDACENLVSFVMLADPSGFAPWLAIPYSGFAAAKFVALTLAMGARFWGLFSPSGQD